jgi:hypothetical protein
VLIAVTTVRTVCPCVVGVVAVAARMFSEEQLEQLRSFPDIGRDDLIRYFTLTQADMAFVDPGRGRGPADRLGLAVQLCALPWLGFVPDEVSSAPPVAVARLADRLGLDPRVHLPTSAPTSVSQRMSPTATCTSIISQPAAGRAIRIADTTQFRGIAAQRIPPSARPPFEPENPMRTATAYPVSGMAYLIGIATAPG